MNQIRLHGRIVKSKEGLNEGVLNSHHVANRYLLLGRIWKPNGMNLVSGSSIFSMGINLT